MSYHGDIRLGETIHIKFTTVNTSGVPTTLAGSPVVSAYPNASTTQLTAGITLTVDFDAVTGLHDVTVVASGGNGYATATNYAMVITTGTVGGNSVVGYTVGSFSVENRGALMPTTAGRTLDVSAGGEAGLDWANIGSPATTQNLSGTTITWNASWDTEVQSEVDDALVARNLDKLVLVSGTADSGTTTSVVDAALTQADTNYWLGDRILFTSGAISGQCRLITAFNAGTDTLTFAPATTQAVTTETYVILPWADVSVRTWAGNTVNGLVSGRVDSSVGAMATNVLTSTALDTSAVNEIVDQSWDEVLSGHLTAGTTGAAMFSASDQWPTVLPGAYGAGTAGNILGNNLNATVSSRATQTSVDDVDNLVDDLESRLGTPSNLGSGATVAANLVDIEGQTDDIGAAGAGLSAIPAVTVGTINANVVTSSALAPDAVTEIRSVFSGTADSGTTTTVVDAALTQADANHWLGSRVLFTSGTISGQCRLITAFSAATDTITFAPAVTQAVTTETYEILPWADVSVRTWLGNTVNSLVSGRVDASVGAMATNVLTSTALDGSAVSEIFVGVLRTALTEAYAADGVQPTLEQLAYMLYSAVAQFAVSGTTITTRQIDGTTQAMTFLTDHATAPTSRVRNG